MEQSILTIVVPTYNHPEMIKYYIEHCKNLNQTNVILAIHDSSTDDKTKQIIIEANNPNIEYFHYDDINVDQKTILCLQSVKTKYVMLCGDGAIFNNQDYYKQLERFLDEDFDLIEIYDTAVKRHIDYFNKLDKDKNGFIIYNDITEHFKDNYWHMPYYGGSIVKASVFKEYSIDDLKDFIGSGFIYPYMIYNRLAKSNSRCLVLGGNSLLKNIYKKDSMWTKDGSAMRIWIDNFLFVVNSLPDLYNPYKEVVLKTANIRTTFLTFKGLLAWRRDGSYNYKLYKQFKIRLKFMSNVKCFNLFLISIFPRWILKLIKR